MWVEQWEEFSLARKNLNEWLLLHPSSVRFFSRDHRLANDNTLALIDLAGKGSFYKTVVERDEPDDGQSRRLTTSITCLESLLELPSWLAKGETEPEALLDSLDGFVERQIKGSDKDLNEQWKSDGAADVYCRVRALASYLRLTERPPPADSPAGKSVVRLVSQAWSSRLHGGAAGLREADVAGLPAEGGAAPTARELRYPANAYLTYWGLLALDGLRTCLRE